jgi:hypothetical protein
MKIKILSLSIASLCFAANADDFVNIISTNNNSYLFNDYTVFTSYTEWTDVGSEKNCNYDKVESDFYYGVSYNQTKSCEQDQTRTKTVTKTYRDGTVETEVTNENHTIEVVSNQNIIGTHLENSCQNILSNNYSEGDGAYHINLNSNPVEVYCDMTNENGGWTLVRRISGSAWNGFSDNLAGTQTTGIYKANLTDPSTFGIQFNTMDYNEVYFVTGDRQKWLITDKDSIFNNWVNTTACGSPATIYRSSNYPTGPAKSVAWCKRTVQPEDPWISMEDHGYNGTSGTTDHLGHSMLYGENNPVWSYYLSNLNGVNILIR